jgi:putative FmdB family regulatory protein
MWLMDLWDERKVRSMPIYTFKCEGCGITIEQSFDIYSEHTIWCEPCQQPMAKQFTAPAIHFKGKGWGGDKK